MHCDGARSSRRQASSSDAVLGLRCAVVSPLTRQLLLENSGSRAAMSRVKRSYLLVTTPHLRPRCRSASTSSGTPSNTRVLSWMQAS